MNDCKNAICFNKTLGACECMVNKHPGKILNEQIPSKREEIWSKFQGLYPDEAISVHSSICIFECYGKDIKDCPCYKKK